MVVWTSIVSRLGFPPFVGRGCEVGRKFKVKFLKHFTVGDVASPSLLRSLDAQRFRDILEAAGGYERLMVKPTDPATPPTHPPVDKADSSPIDPSPQPMLQDLIRAEVAAQLATHLKRVDARVARHLAYGSDS